MPILTSPPARPRAAGCAQAAVWWSTAWWTLHSALWLALDGLEFATEPQDSARQLAYGADLFALARNLFVGVAALGAVAVTIGALTESSPADVRRRERRLGFGLSLALLFWLLAEDLPGLARAGYWVRLFGAP